MATHLKIDMDIKISYSILQLSINKELLYMHELIEKFNKNIQSQNIGHLYIYKLNSTFNNCYLFAMIAIRR